MRIQHLHLLFGLAFLAPMGCYLGESQESEITLSEEDTQVIETMREFLSQESSGSLSLDRQAVERILAIIEPSEVAQAEQAVSTKVDSTVVIPKKSAPVLVTEVDETERAGDEAKAIERGPAVEVSKMKEGEPKDDLKGAVEAVPLKSGIVEKAPEEPKKVEESSVTVPEGFQAVVEEPTTGVKFAWDSQQGVWISSEFGSYLKGSKAQNESFCWLLTANSQGAGKGRIPDGWEYHSLLDGKTIVISPTDRDLGDLVADKPSIVAVPKPEQSDVLSENAESEGLAMSKTDGVHESEFSEKESQERPVGSQDLPIASSSLATNESVESSRDPGVEDVAEAAAQNSEGAHPESAKVASEPTVPVRISRSVRVDGLPAAESPEPVSAVAAATGGQTTDSTAQAGEAISSDQTQPGNLRPAETVAPPPPQQPRSVRLPQGTPLPDGRRLYVPIKPIVAQPLHPPSAQNETAPVPNAFRGNAREIGRNGEGNENQSEHRSEGRVLTPESGAVELTPVQNKSKPRFKLTIRRPFAGRKEKVNPTHPAGETNIENGGAELLAKPQNVE